MVVGAAALGAVLAVVLVGIVLLFVQVSHDQVTQCHQTELIKSRIRFSVASIDAELGKPGTPGYSYYRQHPDELAKAHALNQETLRQFTPSSC